MYKEHLISFEKQLKNLFILFLLRNRPLVCKFQGPRGPSNETKKFKYDEGRLSW